MSEGRLGVLIVDDEPLARQRLRALLDREPEVDVVAEAENGLEAADAVEQHHPDLLLLDIQMAGMNGFEVLQELERRGIPMPLVIFVTAFDEHAVRAFEVHALDYLVKPVERERFSATMRRAKEALWGRHRGELDARIQRIEALLRDASALGHAQSFIVRKGERMIVVRAEEIDWIEASGNYVTLHAGTGEFLLRETMQSIERRLDPERFARIHRSIIVNATRIRELTPSFHGDFYVTLKDGRQLTLSRTYRDRLEALLGKF